MYSAPFDTSLVLKRLIHVGLLAVTFLLNSALAQESTDARHRQPLSPHLVAVEHAARAAARSSSTDAVRTLAAGVFAVPHRATLPSEPATILKSRLIAAEGSYRQGTFPGITETSIVTFVNTLVLRLRLPNYATTTTGEVRRLRMQTILNSPTFMAAYLSQRPLSPGHSINDSMSPLQAYHLTQTLIDQKLVNPLYQVAPELSAEYNRELSLTHDRETQMSLVKRAAADPAIAARRGELETQVNEAITAMTLADGLAIINEGAKLFGL